MGCYIGYTSRSPFDRIDAVEQCTLHFFGVLRLVALPFIRALQNPTFQQNNALPDVEGIVRIFLDTENDRLFPDLHVHEILHQ
ncbi:hypothetical protein TNCV_2393271 [Trichonephila clavipes]|nr:hypothetical protein TNCV_2393271 [Trichonephila clavipes]